jgi:hypothetical protein
MTGHIMVTEIAAVALAAGSAAIALWPRRGRGVSILIPFRCPDEGNQRVKNVEWLKRYWKAQLPGAEVIMGDDPEADQPFSKSVAVNNAAAKAKGDVFVIADADGYVSADSVMHCVEEIRTARKRGQKLWFVPYRLFFRMTEEASRLLLASDPKKPTAFSEPLAQEHVLGDTDPAVGHWYGAMLQIMPREAFEKVGGWDERFRGWGGEDHAAMRAMDTLYGPHKTLPGQVLHVWHPQIGPKGTAAVVHWKERMWEGQDGTGANDKLSNRYYAAQGKPQRMRELLDEARKPGAKDESRSRGRSRRTSM